MTRWMIAAVVGMIPLTAAEDEARRLESVTWDPIRHQLQWVVSKGKMEGKDFKSATKEQYAINIDDATMSFSDETRRFSKREAESVRRLLDFLSRYTAESTIWWEKGMGEVVRKGLRVAAPAPPAEPLGGTGAPAPARAPGFAAKPAPEAPGK